jgi:hypothetical protein
MAHGLGLVLTVDQTISELLVKWEVRVVEEQAQEKENLLYEP